MSTTGTQYALFELAEAIPLEQPVAESTSSRFSDYVVYVDESGDHSLASIDPEYPVFVLALCVFHKRHYSEKIIPAVEKLKFNYFGHDSVVLHENEIRKQKGLFAFLSHLPTRTEFMSRLSSIMDASNFILVTCDVYSGTASLYEGFGAAGNLVIGWWGAGSYFDDWKIEGFDPNANWNFIPNGSFEADSLPWVYAWGDETIAKFSTDTNSAVGGKNSLMIEVVKPSSSSWYDAGIKNNFIIEVEKDSSYTFKFEAKAASARKMHFDVKVGEIKLLNKAIDLTDQVQTFIFPFVASTSGPVTIQLMPTISGATVYMDNMVFEKSKAVVHTGIKTEDVNCSVYPNPAKDKINIKAGNMKIIEILSMDGRILQSVTCTAQNEVIDIHHLKPGIYAARITFENNKTSVNMFVKQ